MTDARNIIKLCEECASTIYGTREPSHMYAQNVALLLAGTAATESFLYFRRQGGFTTEGTRGAWGLWQTEKDALGDNIDYLRKRPDVAERATAFMYPDGGDISYLYALDSHDLCKMVAGFDRLACLMARIHYMRFPAAVPASHEARAAYYKKYYNTTAGKGSPEKYIADFKRLILPHLKDGAQ